MSRSDSPIHVRDLLHDELAQGVAVVDSVDPDLRALVERDLIRHFSSAQLPESNFYAGALDGRIAGIMGFHKDTDEDVQQVYWAVWLYVSPWARGSGVGAALIAHLEHQVRLRGGRKLYLDVGDPSQQQLAVDMYLRRGYRLEGCLLDYFRSGEHKFIYALEL